MNGQDFALSILIGASSMLGFLVLLVLGACWATFLAWVDDYDHVPESNPVTAGIMRLFGYTHSRGRYRHETKDSSDGSLGFGVGLAISFLIPPLGYVSFYQPAIPLAAATLVGLALIARFANRLKKKFDLHVATRDAHK